MNKEEAKEYIKAIRDGLHETGKDSPYRDALIPKMKAACDFVLDEMDQKLPVGRWVKEDNATSYCSECGELIFTVQNWFKYCPQCGTRMNGKGDKS